MVKTKPSPDDRLLVHVRFPEDMIKAVDAHALQLQTEARKIAPKISISRGDAIVSIVKTAIEDKRLRESLRAERKK